MVCSMKGSHRMGQMRWWDESCADSSTWWIYTWSDTSTSAPWVQKWKLRSKIRITLEVWEVRAVGLVFSWWDGSFANAWKPSLELSSEAHLAVLASEVMRLWWRRMKRARTGEKLHRGFEKKVLSVMNDMKGRSFSSHLNNSTTVFLCSVKSIVFGLWALAISSRIFFLDIKALEKSLLGGHVHPLLWIYGCPSRLLKCPGSRLLQRSLYKIFWRPSETLFFGGQLSLEGMFTKDMTMNLSLQL